MAEIINIASRRNVLRFGAGAALATMHRPAIAAPTGDAKLLDLCRRFDDDTRTVALYEATDLTGLTDSDHDQADAVMWRLHHAIEAISAVPATTRAGIQAKAVALGHALKQCAFVETNKSIDEQGENYERLAMSLVRDLASVPV